MKNIHIIPTDKPSRFSLNSSGKYHLTNQLHTNSPNFTNQNIYITSDEEIKEGVNQWYLDKFINKPRNSSGSQYGEKQDVIILTTDQELIKDGVQAIDDEFLEWFVENPSCEEIEVKKGFADGSTYGYDFLSYKIIIPKEEPMKQTDKAHLQWIHDRIVNVYGENENVDFLIKMREIINNL